MATVLQRVIEYSSRNEVFEIYPLGDVHIGARASDERKFRQVVERIRANPNAFWIGMGDYADLITMQDPRFNPRTVAKWLLSHDALTDIAAAQRDKFLSLVEPIADRCLGLISGNHEDAIRKHYERDIYREIVSGIKAIWRKKEQPRLTPPDRLGFGYNGWLDLRFRRKGENGARYSGTRLVFYLHHGFVGGRLQGAKALNMQRMLWTHEAHVIIMGHSHNTLIQWEGVYRINERGTIVQERRVGFFSGSFLKSTLNASSKKKDDEAWADTYSEKKGYLPMPIAHVGIRFRPGAERSDKLELFTF